VTKAPKKDARYTNSSMRDVMNEVYSYEIISVDSGRLARVSVRVSGER